MMTVVVLLGLTASAIFAVGKGIIEAIDRLTAAINEAFNTQRYKGGE